MIKRPIAVLRVLTAVLTLVALLLLTQGQERIVRIPKSPYAWDITDLTGQRWTRVSVCTDSLLLPRAECPNVRSWLFKYPDGFPTESCNVHGIPQLTYSVRNLQAEFNRPIYLTAWLMPSLLINKQASWERYKDFIDALIELDGPNSYRAFAAGVWERHTVDIVRFPFIKVNGKFDLEQMNPVWLAETLKRIKYFVDRGGTVIYTLIDGCSLYHSRDGWWKFHWWNGDKNINGTHNESKAIRHMYNWSDRGIPGAETTKYYVLKFMADMVEILEERFPNSIVYDFNEFGSGESDEWYLNVDRDMFQKFNIPKHRKMFSMMNIAGKLGAIAETMTKYIWQPHGICSLDAYNTILYPGPGMVQASADGCSPPANREQAKFIVFNALSDGLVGFENNRYWADDWIDNEDNYWKQAFMEHALGMKEGFLLWYNAVQYKQQRMRVRKR